MQGPRLGAVLAGALMWLVLCVAGGYAFMANLDQGSVLQLLTGALMGLAGAISHILLSFLRAFRRLSFYWRGILNWLLAFLAFAMVAISWRLTDLSSSAQFNPDFWPQLAKALLLYVGLPMLGVAQLVAAVTSARTGNRRA